MFRKPLEEAFRHALAHLENLDRMPAGAPCVVSACNRQTSQRDVKRAVDSVAEVLKVAKVPR